MHGFVRKVAIVLAFVVSVAYLTYRVSFTLDTATAYGAFASWLLFGAELFGVSLLWLFFFQVWHPDEPPPAAAPPGLTVDVLVPTLNEDTAMLRATLEACARLHYPHRTYVLDDAGRPEVARLAAELGVEYIARPGNAHAKAGNLNYALSRTAGRFVAVLDADHVPEPHFLTRLLGHFADPELAFVQSPHAFYNFASFQSILDHKARQYWDEEGLFYQVVQPGRNRWNCALFTGSAAVFRRDALETVGGFATETTTEDLHTSLRLHARGWKSLAVSEKLISGQAARDVAAFHTQRSRWAEGNLSVFGHDNPLTLPGLTLAQRLGYLAAMTHWAAGLFKVAIYLTPILMLFTGVPPVAEYSWPLLAVTLAHLAAVVAAVKLAGNGHASMLNHELFRMANFWTQAKAVVRALVLRPRPRFEVTRKRGRAAGGAWPYVRAQAVLAVASVLALAWAAGRLALGLSDDFVEPVFPAAWCAFHLGLAWAVVRRAFWLEDRRFGTRHPVHVPVEYAAAESGTIRVRVGVSIDLNETGIGFIAYEAIEPGTMLYLTIRGGGPEQILAEVKAAAPAGPRGWRIGADFPAAGPSQVDQINRLCLHFAVPQARQEYDEGRARRRWWRQKRAAVRYPHRLPVIVHPDLDDSQRLYAVTNDLSRDAFSVLLPEGLPAASKVRFRIPSPAGEAAGEAEVLRSTPVPLAGTEYHRCVLGFRDLGEGGREALNELTAPAAAGSPALAAEAAAGGVPSRPGGPLTAAVTLGLPLLLIQAVVFRGVYRDDLFLRDLAARPAPPAAAEAERVRAIARETLGRPEPDPDRLVLLTKALRRAGDADGLNRVTVALARRAPKDVELQIAAADSLAGVGEGGRAASAYRRLLGWAAEGRLTSAETARVRLGAARLHDRLGDVGRALVHYRAAAAESASVPAVRNELAGVLMRERRFAEAAEALGRPADAGGLALLLDSLLAAGDFGRAEGVAVKLLKLKPGDADARRGLADASLANGGFAEAARLYRPLADARPADSGLKLRLAQAELGLHHYAAALSLFDGLYNAGRRDPAVLTGFTDAAAGAKQPALNDGHLRTARGVAARLGAGEPRAKTRLAWVLHRLGDSAAALRVLDGVLRESPDGAAAARLRFGILLQAGRFEDALNALPAGDPRRPRVRLEALLRDRQYAAAERALRGMEAETPGDLGVQVALAEVLHWRGESAEALRRAERVLRDSPAVTRLWPAFIDGAVSEPVTPRRAELATSVARAELASTTLGACRLARLARVLLAGGRPKLADRVLDRATLRTRGEAPSELAAALAEAGRYEEAAVLIDSLKRPSRRELERLVDLWMRAGHTRRAARTASLLADRHPDDARARRLHARTSLAAGDTAQAVATLTWLLDSLPGAGWFVPLAEPPLRPEELPPTLRPFLEKATRAAFRSRLRADLLRAVSAGAGASATSHVLAAGRDFRGGLPAAARDDLAAALRRAGAADDAAEVSRAAAGLPFPPQRPRETLRDSADVLAYLRAAGSVPVAELTGPHVERLKRLDRRLADSRDVAALTALAWALARTGRDCEAAAALARLPAGDAAPGVLWLQALTHWRLGQADKAAEVARRAFPV